jgi:hypothetical protein
MGFFSYDYRKSVIDQLVELLRRLNMRDETIGFYLRAMHVHTPIYLIIAMQSCSLPVAILILCALFTALVYFCLFDGCVLSKIEKKLDGKDITIVDPFLEVLNYKKTKKNRMRFSFVLVAGYLTFMVLLFALRFRKTFSPH